MPVQELTDGHKRQWQNKHWCSSINRSKLQPGQIQERKSLHVRCAISEIKILETIYFEENLTDQRYLNLEEMPVCQPRCFATA